MKIHILIFSLFFGTVSQAQNIDYEKFIGKTVKIHQSGQLDRPHLFDYEINSANLDSVVIKPFYDNTAESLLTQQESRLFVSNTEGKINNFIKYKSKLSFMHNGILFSIIKYQIVKDSVSVLYKTSQFYKKNGKWEITNVSGLRNIDNVFKLLSNDAFWQFYNKENNPKYPEINKLKPLVKDANGVLNIEKLAEVIKENKARLSKYLDE